VRRYYDFLYKVKDNVIVDVKFKTFGCGAAIAVSSIVSEMAKNKTIEEVMQIRIRRSQKCLAFAAEQDALFQPWSRRAS
jgi:NifU-like protein involved in Fe-S cluster formation